MDDTKTLHIPIGELILCKPQGKRRRIGRLTHLHQDSLTIGNQTLAFTQVKHIRYFEPRKKWQEGLGILTKALGTFFFSISLIGIVSLLLSPIEGVGAVLLILTPIWLGALICILLGRFLFRKGKYDMKEYRFG